MELRRLRHFLAVAEHGNFGRAAAAAHITQPALSRSIQALETEVGAVLFDRRTERVELTDMGRLVLRHATRARRRRTDLDREISLAKGLELGELRVGVGPWGGAVLVAGAVGRLHGRIRRCRSASSSPRGGSCRDADRPRRRRGGVVERDRAARRVRDPRPSGARHRRRRAAGHPLTVADDADAR